MQEPRFSLGASVGATLGLIACLAGVSTAHAEGSVDVALPAVERARLQELVAAAEREHLPSRILVDKAREGVAKRVPPARVVDVVRSLADGLRDAARLAQDTLARMQPASAALLLRTIVDARLLRASDADIRAVLVAAADGEVGTKALGVLVDLCARGYPSAPTAIVVADVARNRPRGLDLLATDIERARARGATTLEALQLGARSDVGKKEHDSEGESATHGPPADRGPDRETSGSRGKALGKGMNNGKGNGKP